MKVLVFGLGVHGGGYAAARYFLGKGDEVRVTDLKGAEQLKNLIEPLSKLGATCVTGVHRKEDFLWADIVVKNPSIPLTHPLLAYAKRIVSDFSFLFSSPCMRKVRLVCITGTKGKTETAYAVAHVLRDAGFKAELCGNMGISGFSILHSWEQGKELPDFLVCELSSWQVRDAAYALKGVFPHASVSMITSFYPDHQNSYRNLSDYLGDKLKLFGPWCAEAIVPDFLVGKVMQVSGLDKKHVWGIERSTGRKGKALLYRNAYALLLALGLKNKQILKSLDTFPGVPHRHEIVGVADNLMLVNDSAATIPEAVHFTCSLFDGMALFLLCGGTDKNVGPEAMIPDLEEAKGVTLLDGSFTRKKLIPLLQEKHIPFTGPYQSMRSAFSETWKKASAFSASHPDVQTLILLSPGAASFEYFVNEFDRGDQFKALAHAYTAPIPRT